MGDEFVLPLFPLSVSVLPGELVPLHIFEDRYKELMAYCLEDPRMRPFGITMVVQTGNQAHLCQTGSAVVVDEVLERHPDGRLHIIARGVGRFQLNTVIHRKSYFEGQVVLLEDAVRNERSPVNDEERVVALLCRLHENRTGIPYLINPSDFRSLSFAAGVFAKFSNENKQTLLEMRSEKERLHYVTRILEIELREEEIPVIATESEEDPTIH